MKNLACFIPCVTDATSLYRGVGPLADVRRTHGDLNLCFVEKVDWSTLKMMDGAFMQRPFTSDHAKIAKLIKANKIPLWVDYDDLLTAVPDFNPTHKLYSSPAVQRHMADILHGADVLTVSTDAIARSEFAMFSPRVLPNALDTRVFEPPKEKKELDTHGRIVLWRGSATHRNDLNLAATACMNLARKYEDVTWVFLGENPWFADFMPRERVTTLKAMDPLDYAAFIRELRADLMIVPLHPCAFNVAKSNCAWLEATSAGTAVLAPNWHEWQKPGITNYELPTPESFEHALDKLLTLPRCDLHQKASESWQYVKENLTLRKVNQQRLAILDSILL